MASPFPGMDPYLEGDFWQEFHERLANQISVQLMPLIKPKYVALLAKRYVLHQPALSLFGLPPEDSFYPDVHIVAPPKSPQTVPIERYGGVMTKPAVTLTNSHYVPQLRLEIKQASNQRLITVIEILSPANKYGGGHEQYNRRRIQLMQASVSLFEIDLLRRGKRIELAGGELPEADYYVYLSRSTNRPFTEIYPMQLRERLPILPMPLFPPDPDVPLDLQAAVDACFDLVGYERLLDYSVAPPPPTLNREDARWLQERLQSAGWRQTPPPPDTATSGGALVPR